MWAILGWVAGRSLAATCRDAAEWLPGAVDKVDLLQVLKCTPASVACWPRLEVALRQIAVASWRGLGVDPHHRYHASVLHYVSALNAMKILPPISKALVSAVQLGLDEVWTGEGSLTKPWIAYALPCAWLRPREFATLQTNRAASLEASELTVFNVCREVTRMAVANSSGFIQIYSEEVVPFFL